MSISFKTVRTASKMAAIYSFALFTAVACAKFEGNTMIKGTANGTANVVRDGVTGGVSEQNINIEKIQTVFLGANEFDEFAWSLKISVTHGARALEFDVYPSVNPFNEDGVQKTVGTITYIAKGVCGTENCSKFAVLIDATDSSNGASNQRVEYWDLLMNNSAPQRRLTNTDFSNVTAAYEAMSGLRLP